MKEESPKDIFDTRCWLYDVNTDPYQVLAEAFSAAGMGLPAQVYKKNIALC
jgi:acyl CoA:acetate/3-ketoacid CoA transferase alpha subunit